MMNLNIYALLLIITSTNVFASEQFTWLCDLSRDHNSSIKLIYISPEKPSERYLGRSTVEISGKMANEIAQSIWNQEADTVHLSIATSNAPDVSNHKKFKFKTSLSDDRAFIRFKTGKVTSGWYYINEGFVSLYSQSEKAENKFGTFIINLRTPEGDAEKTWEFENFCNPFTAEPTRKARKMGKILHIYRTEY